MCEFPDALIYLNATAETPNDGNGVGGGVFARNTDLIFTDSFVYSNYSSEEGGGIYSTGGNVEIAHSLISGNVAKFGAGGIYTDYGDLTITDSAIYGNAANHYYGAGGVDAQHGNVTIERCVISGNKSGTAGGLLCSRCPEVRVVDSEISGNLGDGIGVFLGDLTVIRSLISGNRDAYEAAPNGGGIRIYGGNLTILSSAISNNISGYNGGGIEVRSHYTNPYPITVKIAHSTITGNETKVHRFYGGHGAGIRVSASDTTIVLDHVIVAGNIDHSDNSNDLEIHLFDESEIIVRYSIVGDNTGSGLVEAPLGAPDANGNLIGDPNGSGVIDPLLGPLADNGGWTDTHALLPGSPALQAGDPDAEAGVGDVPLYDQRLAPFARVSGGRIDIGAFEAQVAVPALPGDYNQNGKVDAADYTLWRDSEGQLVDFYAGADGSGNGKIDEDDFLVWREHFGESLPEGGGAAAGFGQATFAAVHAPPPVATPVPNAGSSAARLTPPQRRASLAERPMTVIAAGLPARSIHDLLPSPDPSAPVGAAFHRVPTILRRVPGPTDATRSDLLLIDRLFARSDDRHHDVIKLESSADDPDVESASDSSAAALDCVFAALACSATD